MPGARSTCKFDWRSSATMVSEVRALIAASALPLRNSSARVVASGTTVKRTLARRVLCTPVIVVALDYDFFILLGADKLERSRAPSDFRVISSSNSVGHDANRPLREVPQQGRVRLLQMKYHGEFLRAHRCGPRNGMPPTSCRESFPSSSESNVHLTSREVSGRPS